MSTNKLIITSTNDAIQTTIQLSHIEILTSTNSPSPESKPRELLNHEVATDEN